MKTKEEEGNPVWWRLSVTDPGFAGAAQTVAPLLQLMLVVTQQKPFIYLSNERKITSENNECMGNKSITNACCGQVVFKSWRLLGQTVSCWCFWCIQQRDCSAEMTGSETEREMENDMLQRLLWSDWKKEVPTTKWHITLRVWLLLMTAINLGKRATRHLTEITRLSMNPAVK